MPTPKQISITIGCDPEIFARNKTTGKFVSVHELLPGTKTEPFKVPNGAIQVDGVAAEFNITPAKQWSEFVASNEEIIENIRSRLPENLELVFEPTATFDPDYFKSLPLEVKELGCNPDWNAWTGEMNPRPDGSDTTVRTAAGHIHIGWTKSANINSEGHINDCQIVVRNFDYTLGMMSMKWDEDTLRRSLYGKAGAHRRKPYGVEYRTLSNKWLINQDLQKYIFDTTKLTMINIISYGLDFEEQYKNAAQIIIDNNIKWWDLDELLKHEEELPKGINLRKLNRFYEETDLHLPPIPKKTRTKKDPFHKYGKGPAMYALEDIEIIPVEDE